MRNIICLFLYVGLFSSSVLAMKLRSSIPLKHSKEENSNQLMHLPVLPNELLVEIIRYLKEPDKKSISLVNQIFHGFLNNNTMNLVINVTKPKSWHFAQDALRQQNVPNQISDEDWKEWFSKLQQLRHLQIKNQSPRFYVPCEAFSCLTNLRCLNLHLCPGLTSKQFETMISFLTKLKQMHLPQLFTDRYVEKLQALTSLTNLDLSCSKGIPKDGLSCLSSLCTLNTIKLTNNFNLKDENIQHLSLLSSLYVLDLASSCSIEGAHLFALTSLKEMDLSSCFNVTADSIQKLSQLTGLKKLHMDYLPSIEQKTMSGFSCLTNLVNLSLAKCPNLDDGCLFQVSNLISLEELNLSHNQNLTEQGVTCLSELRNLKNLNLFHCSKIAADVLAGLTNLCGLPKSY